MKTRYPPAILSFNFTVIKAENLTPLDLVEIENLLYKSRSLNMKQKELHQYFSKEKSFYSKTTVIFSDPQIVTSVTK